MKVSVITINLNNASGLKKTIESVINQTFKAFEFFIIDGNSTDKSIEIIKKYNDNINYWVSEADNGIYHAMNKGIRKAKGNYCLFLNSGDFLVNNYVLQNVFSENNSDDFLIGNCQVSKNDKMVNIIIPSDKITFNNFYQATLPHQSTFIKRELFEKHGLYEEKYKIHSDYEFWIRTIIFENSSIKRINTIISDYNLDGISSSLKSIELSKNEINDILIQRVPSRILQDYEYWQEKNKTMEMYYWVKSKPIIHKTIQFLYELATQIVKLKRKKNIDV